MSGNPDTKLTPQQIKKLPPLIQTIVARFEHNPQLYMQLKRLIIETYQMVRQYSLSHDTFCDPFKTPKGLPKVLLNLYGVNEREFKQSLEKVGFEKNDMYRDIYYQTLAIAYLIGLAKGDKALRQTSLFLIDIRLWNGRKAKRLPNFCDPDIARYVVNYELRKHHTFKKSGSALDYLVNYSVPAVDLKYAQTIADNLDSPKYGLVNLVMANYSRIRQLFSSMADAYYRIHKEGKKEVISGQYANQYGEGEMVEARESFAGNIERLVDKILKNGSLKRRVLLTPDSLKLFKDKWNLAQTSVQKMNDWLFDEDNQEEIKYFYELIFDNMKIKDEGDLCSYEPVALASKITSAKKDPNLLKAKEVIDHMLMSIMGKDYDKKGQQTLYRARAIGALAFIIKAKLLLCKKI